MTRQLLEFRVRGPLRRAGDQGGFTMLEALVGVAIMAMVATVMASGVAMAFRAVHFQRSGGIAVDEGRRIMPQLTRDLQVARDTNLGVTELSLLDGAELVIEAADPDGGTYEIRYSLDGTNLVRSLNTDPPRTVARNVVDATFTFEEEEDRVYTVTLVTSGPDTDRAAATNFWRVYQRIDGVSPLQ